MKKEALIFMNTKTSAVFRGLAAVMAFLMLLSMTALNLTFQYDAWLNNNIFGINTSYVVGGSAGTWQYFITAFTTNKGVAIPTTFIDCLNFQGEKGSMGAEYDDGENVEFTVTPAAASAGSAYSYTLSVQGPRGVVSLFDGFFFNDMPAGTGTLELLTDGTFLMTIDPPADTGGMAGPMGPRGLSGSSISGLWVENGDGTLTLSYDHTSAALT